MPQLTIDTLIDLDANALAYRYGLADRPKRRPPQFAALVDFTRAHFGDRVRVEVGTWGFTPHRKVKGSRLITYTGKRREGPQLIVHTNPTDGSAPRLLLDHKTADTYRTNWDIVEWIVKHHNELTPKRARAKKAA